MKGPIKCRRNKRTGVRFYNISHPQLLLLTLFSTVNTQLHSRKV
jgi:hypothetical protein